MSDVRLGELITEEAFKDAIHIAIYPTTSDEILKPGQHIGIINNKASSKVKKFIGIVDPFLTESVNPGDRFYICLYQNTITGMRHSWEHPDFSSEHISYSEKWIKEFADEIEIPYWKLMHDAFLHCQDTDYCGNLIDECDDVPEGMYEKIEEFWGHYQVVTKSKVPSDVGVFYRCCY